MGCEGGACGNVGLTFSFTWVFYRLLSLLLPHRKDVRLPQQLQRAMAAEAEAAREARAKVQKAEEGEGEEEEGRVTFRANSDMFARVCVCTRAHALKDTICSPIDSY